MAATTAQMPQNGVPPPDYTASQQHANTSSAPALGFSKGFLSSQPTVLIMKERVSFSGDDFTVRTASGQDVVRCEGKAFSISNRKEFYSPSGQHLFNLRKRHVSLFKSTYIESPEGETIVELNGRASLGKAKIDVSFTNTCSDPPQPVLLEVRGQFFDRSADITWDGRVVAKIRREFANARELLLGNQTYGVEVEPNVDLALMAAIVVGIDEQRNERH